MNRSLTNEPRPSRRSAQGASVHDVPSAPSITNSTGKAPAGIETTRRSEGRSSVGRNASSHNPAITAVAEVDHGSDTASATARQSASPARFLYPKVVMFKSRLVVVDPKERAHRVDRSATGCSLPQLRKQKRKWAIPLKPSALFRFIRSVRLFLNECQNAKEATSFSYVWCSGCLGEHNYVRPSSTVCCIEQQHDLYGLAPQTCS